MKLINPLISKDVRLADFDERPQGVAVDTMIVHCMYDAAGPLPYDMLRCVEVLERERVSAHYLIGRAGEIWRLVDERNRAWHAGPSRLPFADDHREAINDFSIGVELVGSPSEAFMQPQYGSLADLVILLLNKFPLRYILGHEHISPGRKSDPGPNFNWRLLEQEVKARLLAGGQSEKFAKLSIWR